MFTFHSDVDGSEQPYAVYSPKPLAAASGKKYPLLVSLHAEESNQNVNLRQVLGVANRFGDVAAGDLRNFPAQAGNIIVACPLARGTMGYQGIAERDVYDMLADVERRYPVDRERVYLTGISMGGGGALGLALTRPDMWAAVAPVCPAGFPGIEELAGNALNIPISLFQGDQDPLRRALVRWSERRQFLTSAVAFLCPFDTKFVPAGYVSFISITCCLCHSSGQEH